MKISELPSVIHGILLLNKPQGISSNKALQKAKNLLGIKKAGHTGSLDPLASGMLPLCFGEATKISQFLLDADKRYETTAMLGIKTNTSDSTGDVIAYTPFFSVNELELLSVLEQYKGTIKQTPSMFSALKHQGVPLYRLAREGIEVERKVREISIKQLHLEFFDGAQCSLTVDCSKGTYIRNLVEDIGDSLGIGAHVTRLHRVHTSGFEGMPMYTFEDLELMTLEERLACLIPMDKVVDYFSPIILLDNEILRIRQGKVLNKKLDTYVVGCVRLYDERSCFIGLGELNNQGELKAKRLLAY